MVCFPLPWVFPHPLFFSEKGDRPLTIFFGHFLVWTIVKPLWPTTPKTQKKAKMTQDCKNTALKLPKMSLSKGYFGQFKGYILCSGNFGGFFCSEGVSCHRGFTIVLTFWWSFSRFRSLFGNLVLVFGYLFAYPLLPTPFCGTVISAFPVTRVRNPTKIVQRNLFRWTFTFGVDLFGRIFRLWTMGWAFKPDKAQGLR